MTMANTKRTDGIGSTGVCGVCCRHEEWRPNGMGDLQKGERYVPITPTPNRSINIDGMVRYVNVDYVFLSAVIGFALRALVSSYDIACQWSVNFLARLNAMPTRLRLPNTVANNVLFVVPAFHLEAHIDRCKAHFSPRHLPGLGRTEFECIERNWPGLNGTAASTKEMRPGHRRDVLDDFCGFWNWTKTIRLGRDNLSYCYVVHATHVILSRIVSSSPNADGHTAIIRPSGGSHRIRDNVAEGTSSTVEEMACNV